MASRSQKNSPRSCRRTARRRRSCRLSRKRCGQAHNGANHSCEWRENNDLRIFEPNVGHGNKQPEIASSPALPPLPRGRSELRAHSVVDLILVSIETDRINWIKLSRRLARGDDLKHFLVACVFEIPGFSRARLLLLSALEELNIFFGDDHGAFLV